MKRLSIRVTDAEFERIHTKAEANARSITAQIIYDVLRKKNPNYRREKKC